jgi:hypothetical protein
MSFSIGDLFNPVGLIQDVLGGGDSSSDNSANPLGALGSLLDPAGAMLGGGLGALLGGLFGNNNNCPINQQQHHHHRHHHCHPKPYPFSPGCGNIPPGYFNDPSQLAGPLGSASNKLGSGLGADDFSGIGQLQDQANAAEQAANADPDNQVKQLQAQEALEKLQTAVEQKSNELNIIGELAKKAIDNSKLQ